MEHYSDLRWSLLRKYSRRDIWNTVHKCPMKPLGKYSRRMLWNIVHESSVMPLAKYPKRDIWNEFEERITDAR